MKWIQLSHISQLASFWFSSHNFDEVAVSKNFSIFPKLKRILYGAAMLDDVPSQKLVTRALSISGVKKVVSAI